MNAFFNAKPWPSIIRTTRRSQRRQRIIDTLSAVYARPDWSAARIANEIDQLPKSNDWAAIIRAAAAQAGKPVD